MSDFDPNNNGPEITPWPETTSNNDPNEATEQEVVSSSDHESLQPATDSKIEESVPMESTDTENQVPISQPKYEPATYETSSNQAYIERKKAPIWIFAIGGVIFALLLIIIAFITIPTLSNAFALATMSPAKYYQKVEKANMNKGINELTSAYGVAKEAYEQKDSKKSKVEVATSSNMKLTVADEITSLLGIENIKPIEARINSLANTEKARSTIELLYDSKTLATFDTFIDVATSDIMVQIKELSNDYLLISQNTLSNYSDTTTPLDTTKLQKQVSDFYTNGKLSERLLNTILKKYSHMAISEITDVSLEKKVELDVGDVASKNTKITVSLSQEDLIRIATVVLEKAENDEEIIKICEDSDICTKAQYKTAINAVLSYLESSYASNLDEPLDMIVWVNNKGEIIGRELTFASDGNSIHTGIVSNKKSSKLGYKVWFTADDIEFILFEGNGVVKNKAFSGESKLSFTPNNINVYDFDVTYKDLKFVNKNKGYYNGNIVITCDMLPTYSIKLLAEAQKDSQKLDLSLLNGKSKILSLVSNTKEKEFKDFDLPAKKDTYDMATDFESYLSKADLKGFLENIQTVLNIEELNNILSSLIYGMDFKPNDIPEYPTDDSEDVNSEDIDTDVKTSNSMLDGVEVDENGYYTYEADYDAIKAAGKGSTGYNHFSTVTSDILNDFKSLIKKTYGSDLQEQEPYYYNNVSGNVDDNYEYTYYSTTYTWTNSESYNLSVNLKTDSVTDELIEIQVYDTDEEKGMNFTLDCISLLEGGLSKSDRTKIANGLTLEDGKDYVFYNYGAYEIYFSKNNNNNSFSISPASTF